MKKDMGLNHEIEIPADMVEEAQEWRDKLIEAVAESDEALMEKFFEDSESITKEEMFTAIRKATIEMSVQPIMCGSAFKNKGVQTMLDAVMAFLPSPMDKEVQLTGINPKTDEETI